MRLFLDLEPELGSSCRISIVISDRKARKTEVTQSRFEQIECLFANVQWRRLKKNTSRSGFFLCFLRCCRERYIPIRLLKWWHIGDITAEDNIYAASWFPSQTWSARQRGREDGDVEISRSAFFYVPVRIPAHFKFPSKCHRRRCGNSADNTLTKNRTYHNGMRSARAIVETLRQFFDVQSNPVPLSRFRLCALWRNCVPRETLIVIVYVSGRVTPDNRFHDYALPVASQLMHVQRPDWMRFDGHY